jgi:nitrate reductase gamma subunit
MHTIYNIVSGPLAVLAFMIFIGGIVYRLLDMIFMTWKKERFIFSYMSLKYGLRSIYHWLIPFGTVNWKRHPYLTVVTFLFHICLIVTPIFLLSHIVLWEESWNIDWVAIPNGLADIMTVIVIASCGFFLARRLKEEDVKFLTSTSDYILLAIVAAPFITGFIAYHQLFSYQLFHILHILTGEIMLVAIPFTRLSHMIFAPFTRAYIGSEFGGVRGAKDW